MKGHVADTHVVLWMAAGERARLGRAARRVVDGLPSGRAFLFVSVVSLWEIALLHDEGKIRLPAGFSAWTDALESVPGVRIEPLTRGDVEAARALRDLVDPHDRLIAGTAMRLSLPLLTADARLAKHSNVRALW